MHIGAHVMVIHHSGKDQARGARGHSLLRAATDTEIEVKAVDRSNGHASGVLTVTKQRDMDGDFRRAFTLRAVPLGIGRSGKPLTSAVACLEDEEVSRAVLKEPTAAEQEVLGCLRLVLSSSTEPAKGATAADIRKAWGKDKEEGNKVRSLLNKLKTKGQVVSLGDGRWVLNGQIERNENAVAQGETERGVDGGAQQGATASATSVFG